MVHVGLPVFWSQCRSQGLRFGRKRDTMRTVHTVQHNAMQCSSVHAQHNVHSTAQHNTIQYSSTVQYDIIQNKTIQYSIVLYNTTQSTRLWIKLEEIKYNYNYKTKTEQTLTNHIKHNGNYIYLVRLFTKIIIFVFTKLERPFLCPRVLPEHCSDLWQTTYFKRNKSALKDLKDKVLVCPYYKKGSQWRPRDGMVFLFYITYCSETSTLESNQIAWSLTMDGLQ